MAGRKKKLSVDYFPHFVVSGKTLFTLERMFGDAGYSILFKTLELLAGSDGHSYDFSSDSEWFYLCARFNSDNEKVEPVLNMMAKLDFIDKELYGDKILWCQKLVDNLAPVYEKRKSELPPRPIAAPGIPIAAPGIPQSKVKGSKVKKEFLSDSDEFRLSNLLFSKILLRNPEHKKPNLQTWARHVDYMIRLDNRDPQKIANVISWAQSDSFEHTNILSTSKLRDRFDALVLKMKPQTKTSAADNAREGKVAALLEGRG